MMRRDHLVVGFLAVVISLLMATTAFAAIHFKGGFTPSGNDNGLTLSVTVALTGLANADAIATISVTANPTATCTNPSEANQPPGHNPAPTTVTGATAIPANSVKNGNATITLTTSPPSPNPIPGAPDCPGGASHSNWTEAINDMAFVSPATIKYGVDTNNNSILDPSEVQFTGTCRFTPSPSTNGSLTVRC